MVILKHNFRPKISCFDRLPFDIVKIQNWHFLKRHDGIKIVPKVLEYLHQKWALVWIWGQICEFNIQNSVLKSVEITQYMFIYELNSDHHQRVAAGLSFFALIMQLRLPLWISVLPHCFASLPCYFYCWEKSFNFLMSSSCFTC